MPTNFLKSFYAKILKGQYISPWKNICEIITGNAFNIST